jgi:putative methionine-R-sulfoxide reductase with GAF domain
VSKFDLRDISERLAASQSTEAVLFEYLGYLQSIRPDWRVSLAFYEVSRDALVNVYVRDGARLQRRDLLLPVDQLPARLVRKFFHPSAFFNHTDRRNLLTQLFQTSPYYELSPLEAPSIRSIAPLANWQSAVAVPLADAEDILALMVLASDKKNAFGSKAMGEIVPVRALASMALAQHLHRASRQAGPADPRQAAKVAAEFQDQVQQLARRAAELEAENQDKAARMSALTHEIESLDRSSGHYREELERVKGALGALEEQNQAATQHLSDAYAQLDRAQNRLDQFQHTLGFLRDVCQVLAEEHDRDEFARVMVSWFCEQFGVERCSLMVADPAREVLHIAAHRGIDPLVARQVKVRVGQGIAGWVARNRKPLLVRVREDANGAHTGQDAYNSDSFVAVPLVHNNKLHGVLNLSNKKNGEVFEEHDLDRAVLAGALLAMTLDRHDSVRRAAAWS